MARVAIAVGQDVEDSEFSTPYERLLGAGHDVVVFGIRAGERVKGKRDDLRVTTERAAGEIDAAQFDALVIPGGYSPDHLRLDPDVVSVVRQFCASGKPVAAICHGPQLLIEAGVVRGRTLTSWPSVHTDLVNAGAGWVDRAVMIDGNLITARKPDDLDAFCAALLDALAVSPRRQGRPRSEQPL